jgi:hypothetical protein
MKNTVLTITSFLFTASIYPMLQPYNQLNSFIDLPQDIHNTLFFFVILSDMQREQKTSYTIHSFARTSKKLNKAINNPGFCLNCIKYIGNFFDCSDESAATWLHTTEARNRLMLQTKLKDLCYSFAFSSYDIQILLHKKIALHFTYDYRCADGTQEQLTPLMITCVKCSWENNCIIQGLLAHGVHINGTNQYGQSAIMLATKHNKLWSVKHLTASIDCNINQQDKDGNTALMYNLQPRHNSYIHGAITAILLNAGADPERANYAGITPLIAAQTTHNTNPIIDEKKQIITLLEKSIAKKHAKQKQTSVF